MRYWNHFYKILELSHEMLDTDAHDAAAKIYSAAFVELIKEGFAVKGRDGQMIIETDGRQFRLGKVLNTGLVQFTEDGMYDIGPVTTSAQPEQLEVKVIESPKTVREVSLPETEQAKPVKSPKAPVPVAADMFDGFEDADDLEDAMPEAVEAEPVVVSVQPSVSVSKSDREKPDTQTEDIQKSKIMPVSKTEKQEKQTENASKKQKKAAAKAAAAVKDVINDVPRVPEKTLSNVEEVSAAVADAISDTVVQHSPDEMMEGVDYVGVAPGNYVNEEEDALLEAMLGYSDSGLSVNVKVDENPSVSEKEILEPVIERIVVDSERVDNEQDAKKQALVPEKPVQKSEKKPTVVENPVIEMMMDTIGEPARMPEPEETQKTIIERIIPNTKSAETTSKKSAASEGKTDTAQKQPEAKSDAGRKQDAVPAINSGLEKNNGKTVIDPSKISVLFKPTATPDMREWVDYVGVTPGEIVEEPDTTLTDSIHLEPVPSIPESELIKLRHKREFEKFSFPPFMKRTDLTFYYDHVTVQTPDGEEDEAEIIVAPYSMLEGSKQIIIWMNSESGSHVEYALEGKCTKTLHFGYSDIVVSGEIVDGTFVPSVSLTQREEQRGFKLLEDESTMPGTKGHVMLTDTGIEIHIIPISFENNNGRAEFYYLIKQGNSYECGDTGERPVFKYRRKEMEIMAAWKDDTLYATVKEKI